MTMGSKIAVVLLGLAGLAMAAGLVVLLTGAFGGSSDVARADVDLEAVGSRFEEQVRAPTDLAAFAEKLNTDGLYEGDGTIIVEMARDGSVLGWVEKDSNGGPTLHHDLEESATKELDEPESPEVVFWVRAEKGEQRLVVTDRYHNAYAHDVSDDFTKTPVWREMLGKQKAYYGEKHWRAPGFYVFVVPGYYGRYSSARSASLGRRAGSGGIGGGK